MSPRRSPGRRLFDVLVRLYPAGFRARYGTELGEFFDADRDRAFRAGGLAVAGFWLSTLVDLVRSAIRLRLRPALSWFGRLRNRASAGPRYPAQTADIEAGGDEPTGGSGRSGGGDPSGEGGPRRAERLTGLLRDLAYAGRSLLRQPTFALAAVVTLALGIGAPVSIFSVADAVLFRPLPYPAAEDLVAIGMAYGGRVSGMSAPNVRDIEASAQSFASISMSRVGTLDLSGEGEPERLIGAAVTAGWFEQLGATVEQGRLFVEAEDRPGVGRVGVISHGLWMRRWNGDPAVIGGTVTMNAAPFTIVGVTRTGFAGPAGLGQASVEVWYPLSFVERGEDPLSNRADPFLTVLARLAPGFSPSDAAAEMERFGDVLVREHPVENGRVRPFEIGVVTLRESTLGNVRSRIALFGGAVLLLFLAALSNAAGLLLGRVAQRGREMAVRRALGAARGRIVRQVLAESAVLAGLGCGLGILLAMGGLRIFSAVQAGSLPRADGLGMNLRVLAFAVVATVLVAFLVGVVPGLRASRLRSADALRSGTRHTGASAGRFRRALVVVETGLALMLLAGAGLLMNSFVRLSNVPLGFEPDDVVTMEVFVGGWYATSADRISIYRRLMERLDESDAVQAASVTTDLPLGLSKLTTAWATDLGHPDQGGPSADAGFHYVAPGYFATLGIPLLPGGRDFTDRDIDQRTDAAIINRALSVELFGGQDPLGQRVSFGSLNGSRPLTVVGVVGDVRHQGLDIGRDFEIYVPHNGGFIGPPLNVLIRSDRPLEVLVPVLRSAVRAVEPDLPIGRIAPLSDRVRAASSTPRFHAWLTVLFALSAMAIAVTGLYGTMAHAVGQRTREIGVRLALGADAGRIVKLVLGGGMSLSLVGIGLGLAGALLSGRALAGLLFGITPADLPTLLGVALLMAAVQLAACLLPARRAAALPVARTLRADGD